MKFEPVIGLEIHIQLKTRSKMFCRCSTEVFGKSPNSYVCPTCLGLPGALPVTNAEAVRLALLAGEAFGSDHPKVSHFDRKNYFYPDLPKGYQISQYQNPFNIGGKVKVDEQFVSLTRAHLEEDTGKLIHLGGETLVDFNRSGIPLLEIVTEPVIESAWLARAFGQKIQQIMRYTGVSDADMEKGSLRVDANISLRPAGSKKLGNKVEVKNMNSFRSVERALTYEIERQTKVIGSGKKVVIETRGWDEGKGVTVSQRVKEEAEDYRYFPEPDLPRIEITEQLLEEIRKNLEELPDDKSERFTKEFGLSQSEAEILTADFGLANFYEEALGAYQKVSGEKLSTEMNRRVSSWLASEFLSHFKKRGISWKDLTVTPAHLAELIYLFDQGKITATSAKMVMDEMFEKGEKPSKIIDEKGFVLQSDVVKLTDLARVVLEKNPKAVADYRSGKGQALKFLIGQLQREARGQADPTIARQALERALK